MKNEQIFTIGHSTHSLEYFLELLETYDVNCVVDVRSIPMSKFNPQFNKNVLKNFLNNNNIKYLHFGNEFGARYDDPDKLDEKGKVCFELVANSKTFKDGVERIKQGINMGYVIALMCSESNPLECHRFSMVSLEFAKQGYIINHILKNKTLLNNKDLEDQLLNKYHKKVSKNDLFTQNIIPEAQLKEAYRLINNDIAYISIKR